MADCKRKTANLWDFEQWLTDRGVTYTKDGDTYTFASQQALYSTPFYFSQTNITISISGLIEAVTATNPRVHLLKADGTNAKTDALTTAVSIRENVSCAGLRFDWSTPGNIKVSLPMLNEGSTALPYEPYGWVHSLRKLTTATDTLTSLPADIYADGNTATIGISGNTVQNGTPTPENPIMPQSTGDLETVGEKAGQYKIPISSADTTTPVYLGEVESTRRIKKLVLDGSEPYQWGHSSTRLYSWYLIATDLGAPENTPFLCTHGVTVTSASEYVYGKVYCDNTLNIGIFPDSLNSESEVKQWLATQAENGTPVIIWYVLATEETGIVNEPLQKIGGYADEVSNITIPVTAGGDTLSVDTTVQPSEVTVNYKGWHPAVVHERDNGAWT